MSKKKTPSVADAVVEAMPAVGEIEGQLLALDLIAANAATKLLRFHDSRERKDLIADVLREVDSNCRSAGLHLQDIKDAREYAEGLLNDAQDKADGLDDVKHAYPNRVPEQ